MANEVGRVHVRVLPDTTGFAMRTKQKLKALKEQKYKVPVDIDEDKFQAQLKGMIARTNLMLAREQNHIRFHAELATTKKDARAQALKQRTMYQAMADDQRAVKFDAELDKKSLTADVPVRHSIDSETFTRDLTRAVKRATSRVDISVWGDRKTVERQADRAASIFRERLEYINRDTAVFGDTARIDEQALKVARSTRERLREALKDFNVFGAPKDIEDQTSDAIDVFKRKWREAQGEFNIRANLEADTQKFQDLIDDVDDMRVAVEKGTAALGDHERQWRDVQEQISYNARQAAKYRGKLDGLQLWDPQQYRQWWEASIRVREHREEYERLVEVAKDLGHKLRHTKLEVELDHGELAEAEASLDRWRQRVEMQALELDTDIKTAAAEAALLFLSRPRVVELRTRITGRAMRTIDRLGEVSRFNWGSIGKVLASFGTRSTGIRMLWQTAKDIVDIVPKLDMMIPALAKTTALATAGIAAAGGLLASAVSIGADMMKAGQALLIAPAGLAGLGVAALVYASAWKAMEQHVPEVEKAYASLSDTLGSDFWKADGGRVSGFFVSLFNALERYSPRLTKSLADVTAALAEGMAEAGTVQGPRFMENMMRGLKGAEGGFRSLGSALTTLMGAGSDSFESLGFWFTDVMGDFDSWVKRNDANGNITRWIDEGAQAIRDIGSLIYSTGSMFATFGEIVKEAGGPSLSDFAAGMRRLREAMKGPGFRGEAIPTLRATFDFLGQLGTLKPQLLEATGNALEMIRYSLNNLSGPITSIFGATLDGFNSPVFMAGFEQFIDGMGSFLTDIAPGWERFVAELGGLFGVVGEGAQSFGPAFNELLLLVSNIGANLHPGLENFLRFIGPELEKLILAVGPGLEDMATGVSDILANKGFQRFLSDVADKLGTIAGYATDAGNALLDLVDAMFTEYDHAPKWMQDLSTWLLALGGAAIFAAPLIRPLLKPLTALLGIFKTPLKRMAKEGLLGAVERLSKINWGQLWRGVGTGVAGGARGLLPRLLGVFSGPVGWGVLIASAIKPLQIGRIGEAILEALGLSDTWAGDLLRYVMDKFESIFGDINLLRVGSPPINAIWTAIERAITGWDNGGIFGAVEGALSGLWEGLTASFRFAWEMIKGALTDGWDYLTNAFRNWEPTSNLGIGIKHIIESIPGLLGFDDAGNWSFGTLTSSWVEFGKLAWDAIKLWLDSQIDRLISDFNAWEPTTKGGRAFKNLVTTIAGLLGFDKDGTWSWDSLTSNWKSFAVTAWNFTKSWLDEQIDELWEKFTSWEPVAKTIDFLEKIGDAIARTLGFDDFSDLTRTIEVRWEKLKDDVEACLNNAWSKFRGWLDRWSPTIGRASSGTGTAGERLGEWVRELLNLDEGWAWDCSNLEEFWETAWTGFKKWAQERWDDLVGEIDKWEPTNPAFELGRWLGELLRKLFGKEAEPEDNGRVDWWPAVKAWLKAKWDKLVEDIQNWEPTSPAGSVGKLLWEWLKGIFGKDEEPEDNGQVDWWPAVKAWLKAKWDKLIEDIRNWEPTSPAGSVGKLLWKWLRGIFGKKEEPEDNGQVNWWDSVKAWLKGKWEQLLENIENWEPTSPGFHVGKWLGRLLRKIFSPNGQPDPTIDLSGWQEKIKRGLTIALGVLLAGLLVWNPVGLAVLGLGLLIVKWLFGDDAEGGGVTFAQVRDELVDRVMRWWIPIREGLSNGIEKIGRAIGEIIHDVICLPQYILDEIFVDCFGEEGMSTRVAERVGRWAGPMLGGLASGIAGIRERLNGYTASAGGNGGPGNGLLDRLIGTTPAHVDGTVGNLGRLGAGVATFGAGVVGEFASMGGGTRREIAGLTDNTEAEFGTMSSKSQGDARSMNSGVVGQFAAMATRAIAQAVRLQGSAQRAMAQANVQMVAQGRAANVGFVAQMSAMAARSISVANSLRSGLQSALRINAAGSGSYTGGTFVSGLAAGLSRAVGVARSIAGGVRSALRFSAYSSGASVGGTFASGLRSRIGAVSAAARSLAAAARTKLPNSPAKEGPFSGSGWGGWGESIGDELARGLKKAAPVVAAEANRLMSGVHGALDSRSDLAVGVDFERNRKRHLLSHETEGAGARTTNVNVNVESRSEDPLQDGNRFGGDIAFALRGVGLA